MFKLVYAYVCSVVLNYGPISQNIQFLFQYWCCEGSKINKYFYISCYFSGISVCEKHTSMQVLVVANKFDSLSGAFQTPRMQCDSFPWLILVIFTAVVRFWTGGNNLAWCDSMEPRHAIPVGSDVLIKNRLHEVSWCKHSSAILCYLLMVDCVFSFFFSAIPTFRVKFFDLTSVVADSGCLCGMGITGGKLGLFAFAQNDVTWSNMKYQCLPGWVMCSDVT